MKSFDLTSSVLRKSMGRWVPGSFCFAVLFSVSPMLLRGESRSHVIALVIHLHYRASSEAFGLKDKIDFTI